MAACTVFQFTCCGMDFALRPMALTFTDFLSQCGRYLPGGSAMWSKIKLLFGVSMVTLSLTMTVDSSSAQDNTLDDAGRTTTALQNDNDGFDLGWIGLAGLLGLAGLMPRDQPNRNGNDVKR